MFRRIPWDDLLADIRVLGLLLLCVGAAVLVARLVRMSRKEIEERASLPLDND